MIWVTGQPPTWGSKFQGFFDSNFNGREMNNIDWFLDFLSNTPIKKRASMPFGSGISSKIKSSNRIKLEYLGPYSRFGFTKGTTDLLAKIDSMVQPFVSFISVEVAKRRLKHCKIPRETVYLGFVLDGNKIFIGLRPGTRRLFKCVRVYDKPQYWYDIVVDITRDDNNNKKHNDKMVL